MNTRQLRPKRQHRKQPNMSEKLAAALLHIKRGVEGDDWLIKGDLRNASAKAICASVDFDHVRRWAEGGSNDPQNLQPLPRPEHQIKSRKDNTEIAKGKRYGAKEEQHRARLLAKQAGEVFRDATKNPKPQIPSRPFPTPEQRRAVKDRIVRNSRTVEPPVYANREE